MQSLATLAWRAVIAGEEAVAEAAAAMAAAASREETAVFAAMVISIAADAVEKAKLGVVAAYEEGGEVEESGEKMREIAAILVEFMGKMEELGRKVKDGFVCLEGLEGAAAAEMEMGRFGKAMGRFKLAMWAFAMVLQLEYDGIQRRE
ncbi:hypothetical protein GP486_008705 [Trichoglossum hirsutum]|uniref:Uncharacterized protein n=1 Tax=Trichoglossum hirsutum TaxID=265104 RepID=A0A9P8I8J1_9PEZI|nr:hypothetical protein GP486_008705 [Trichoglossum hirsutum]